MEKTLQQLTAASAAVREGHTTDISAEKFSEHPLRISKDHTEGGRSTLTPTADHWLKTPTVTRNTMCHKRGNVDVKRFTYVSKLAGKMIGENVSGKRSRTHTEERKATTNADHETGCNLTAVSSLNLEIC